ncbi:MAG: hypothetical protein JWQ79_329 [Mucilaginibacter sp.]|nr:hypothetical protein [Mucilaginibacter sp.]
MKLALTILFVSLAVTGFSQRQNVYFFKNNGSQVTERDSADYIRIVHEPDSGAVNYKVLEYYKNGKPKLSGESSTVEPLTLEGQLISFYPTGRRAAIENFKNGHTISSYTYYPNGKMQAVREYPDSLATENEFENHLLITYNDTTGKSLINNGEGYYTGYDIQAKDRYNEGKILKGKREGEWKGNYAADKVTITEEYKNGKLISGTSTTADYKKYTYITERSMPDAGKYAGLKGLNDGLTMGVKTIVTTRSVVVSGSQRGSVSAMQMNAPFPRMQTQTPKAGIDAAAEAAENEYSRQQVHGVVKVAFIIDKTGVAKNFIVAQPLSGHNDEMALKMITDLFKNKNDIKPGILYGRPVDTQYVVPVTF